MHKVFFSYSHKNESVRDELEVHLSMLKRQGVIQAWHDRRITSGSEINGEISKELENADIILLLVSPYFLASDYCYDIEMTRAMEKHELGEARVIPIILDPCDWHHAPFGRLLAAPSDSKPISKFANQHDAYLDIVKSIRMVIKELGLGPDLTNKKRVNSDHATSRTTEQPRSSNLRVKKDFSDQDKDSYLENTYEYIANYFEGSLKELSSRNPEIEFKFKRIDANHFTAIAYKNGSMLSQCKIWLGGSFGGISYSSNASSSDNSMNDSLSVETDGHILFLRAFAFAFSGRGHENEQLSHEGAAEYFWEQFIRPLQ